MIKSYLSLQLLPQRVLIVIQIQITDVENHDFYQQIEHLKLHTLSFFEPKFNGKLPILLRRKTLRCVY